MKPPNKKQYLRKAKEAVDKFNRAKITYENVLNRVAALHSAVRPLVNELSTSEGNKIHPFILSSDFTIPIEGENLLIKKDTPPDKLKEYLNIIFDELTKSGVELDAIRKDIEGKHKHLQNLSQRGGLLNE